MLARFTQFIVRGFLTELKNHFAQIETDFHLKGSSNAFRCATSANWDGKSRSETEIKKGKTEKEKKIIEKEKDKERKDKIIVKAGAKGELERVK